MVEVKEAVKVTSTHSKGAWVDRRVDLAVQYPLRPPFDRLPLLPRLSFDLAEVELYRGYPPSPHLPASAADSLRRAAGRGGAMAGGGLEFVVFLFCRVYQNSYVGFCVHECPSKEKSPQK